MEKNIKAHLLVILATFLVAGSFLVPIITFKKDYRLSLKGLNYNGKR